MKEILEFSKTGFETVEDCNFSLKNVDLCVFENELTGIYVDTEEKDIPLFDLAQGLAKPSSGAIKFMGKRWQDMRDCELLKNRSRIGRTLASNAWLSNLTVAENLLLAQRHHTKRIEEDIREEADRLASVLEIGGIPSGYSRSVPDPILRRCELMRIFLGQPSLVLIELAESKGDAAILDKLFVLCHEPADNDMASLLMTRDSQIWERVKQETNRNFTLQRDGTLKQLESPV